MKSEYQPRIRIFAGPNGSGKSVLKTILRPDLLGVYINPEINISRVKYRVSQGGHDVPEDKIISRYYRSLDLLFEAIKNSWRAYIFDNSASKEFLLAETKEGKIIEMRTENIPAWFNKFVIQKLTKI